MPVRLFLKAPHTVQKSSVELSLTVLALMLCWPAECCGMGASDMMRGRGFLSCASMALDSFCLGCSLSLSLDSELLMMTYCVAAHLAAWYANCLSTLISSRCCGVIPC